jgi:hypothetical protein
VAVAEQPGAPPDLHTDRAHSARVYDYILGGKDMYGGLARKPGSP